MNPYNILIVEDEVDIARAIEAYLNNQGYKTFMAGNGIEGLEVLSKEEIHLAIVDVMMPKMDGYTATREIRTLNNSKCANIPIIAMTANAFEEDRKKAIKAGMNGHIAKPISSDVILENLDQIFGR